MELRKYKSCNSNLYLSTVPSQKINQINVSRCFTPHKSMLWLQDLELFPQMLILSTYLYVDG